MLFLSIRYEDFGLLSLNRIIVDSTVAMKRGMVQMRQGFKPGQ